MTSIDHGLLLAFAVLYPIYAFYAYRKIKADLIANKPGRRLYDYKETIAWLWFFAIAGLISWFYQQRPLSGLGLDLPAEWPAWLGLVLASAISFFLFAQLGKIEKDEEQRGSLAGQLSESAASEFLPRTQVELKWFVILSFTAGICEEILFRGFLIWYFEQFSSTTLAVILSSVLFGAAHSYQGFQGGLKAGVMGLVMALSYVLSGSLLVPIVLHIVGDIYSGMLGHLAFGKDRVKATTGD